MNVRQNLLQVNVRSRNYLIFELIDVFAQILLKTFVKIHRITASLPGELLSQYKDNGSGLPFLRRPERGTFGLWIGRAVISVALMRRGAVGSIAKKPTAAIATAIRAIIRCLGILLLIWNEFTARGGAQARPREIVALLQIAPQG